MLFSDYIMVDWSASGSPATGCHSVWIAHRRCESAGGILTYNPGTRREAMAIVADKLQSILRESECRKVLLGFDFPFGFPAGTAKAMGLETPRAPVWEALWARVSDEIRDDWRNGNNRFEVATSWQRKYALPFHGWGSGLGKSTLPKSFPQGAVLGELRKTEECARATHGQAGSAWRISGIGSVGGQMLVGIPHLFALRKKFAGKICLWPFETGFSANFQRRIVVAEIYPRTLGKSDEGKVNDEREVRGACDFFWERDKAGKLPELFDPKMDSDRKRIAIREEGWMLGLRPTV